MPRFVSVYATLLTTMLVANSAAADEATTPAGQPERSVQYGAGASLAFMATRTTNPAMSDPPEAMGWGPTLRLGGMYGLGGGGFNVGPYGAFETGLGYSNIDGQFTGHMWFLLRLELGAQADLRITPDLEVSVRGGLYGHYNAAREVGADDDVLFVKAMAHYQKVAVAAGAGQQGHLLFGAQYQVTRDYYLGVEYARFTGASDMADYGSDEVRLFLGLW